MAILDFSKDSGKSIAIHFHTKELGPEGQPLYYHTPENPAGMTLRHFMAIAKCLCRSSMANKIPVMIMCLHIIVIKGHVEFRTVKETKGGDIDFTFEARAQAKWTGNTSSSYCKTVYDVLKPSSSRY